MKTLRIATLLTLLTLLASPADAMWGRGSLMAPVTQSGGGGGPPPSSTPCDIGPSYIGAIPAAATQAGLTHCAANYDFPQTQSFTDGVGGQTHQWSNLNSWFKCNGSASSPYIMGYSGDVPCNDGSHQVVGLDGGTQVLKLSYFLTDKNNGVYGNTLQTFGPNGLSTPYAATYYIETVVKSNQAGLCNGFCLVWDMSTFTNEGGSRCFVSQDSEFDENGSGAGLPGTIGLASWNFPCGSTSGGGGTGPFNNLFPVSSGSSYTTYGTLITDDNATTYGACNYSATGAVSGLGASSFLGCVTSNVGGPAGGFSPFVNNLWIYFVEGPQTANQGGTDWTATSHTTFLERMTVWECAGYLTGQCGPNLVTTHP